MSRAAAIILILIGASAAFAQSQPHPAAAYQPRAPWAVSVIHTIDVEKLIEVMRDHQKLRVGVAGTAPRFIYNITTGLVVDDRGHVVTRLSNLDPQDTEHKLAVMTADGSKLDAKLVGIDFATGFAVLEVSALRAIAPKIAAPRSMVDGAAVKILSADVVRKSVTERTYVVPSITVSQGHVFLDSFYSRARGALTLRSDSLLARSDSSVVLTADDQVVGMAQYAGFGRAYLFTVDFIRDTIVKRVVDKMGNVPAGWLGVKVDGLAELSEADFGPLGLQNRAGVLVREVTPQGSAFQAGLLPRDVITRVDEFDIAGIADLKAVLSPLPAGRSVTLRALRDHQPVELKAVLGAKPMNEPSTLIEQALDPAFSQREQLEKRLDELKSRHFAFQKGTRSRETAEALRELEIEIRLIYDTLIALQHQAPALLPTPVVTAPKDEVVVGFSVEAPMQDVAFSAGFIARDIGPQLAANFQTTGGVLVTRVVKDSLAERAGLKAGDVIAGIQETVLLRTAQLQALLAAQRGPIALKVVRNREPLVVSLNIQ